MQNPYIFVANIFGHVDPKITTTTIILLVLVVVMLSFRMINRLIPILAGWLSRRHDSTDNVDRLSQIRRAETYLSVASALLRTLIVVIALYLIWGILSPHSAPIALVGASTLFAVLAGATVAPLLRDFTSGTAMFSEQWYHVGDHVAVDPFNNLSGIVEQMTLRTTKLRSLNGEAIWIHNQHIQAVRVTARGVRTIAIDAFVRDPELGQKIINEAITALPVGPTMVATPLTITETEKLSDELWRVTAVGQTAPGREWLLEDFALKAIAKRDIVQDGEPIIIHGPIVRFADAVAEYRFKRAVRVRPPARKKATTGKSN